MNSLAPELHFYYLRAEEANASTSSTPIIDRKGLQEVSPGNSSLDSNNAASQTKDAIALFFQAIKMYKKWHSKTKLVSKFNSSINSKDLQKIVPDMNASVHSLKIDANVSNILNGNISEIAEASPLIGAIPPIKISGKKKYIVGRPVKEPSPQDCAEFCKAGHHSIGICMSSNDCYQRGGAASSPCCGVFYVCCLFVAECGSTSDSAVVHFHSPGYPLPQRGSLACDLELVIGADVCAVRLDHAHVSLHPKYGGVCDVDQILVLNSVDGPTGAQCGELTGYSTTVAVEPSQAAPLKVVVIVQSEGNYFWDIRLRQVKCANLEHFRSPGVCGSKTGIDTSVSFYQLLDLWRNAAWHPGGHSDPVWWRQPAPTFNRFYYESTRRAAESLNRRQDVAEDRIIAGLDAAMHEFPWQVAIITKRVFFCGGVVVNDEYVLSAAHCFLTQDTAVSDLVVFLGDHDLTSSNETISEIRGVREVNYHAHFHSLLLSNDIALLRLDRPLSFSQRIRPICLPEQALPVLGQTGVVTGWGITSYPDGKPNAVLQKLRVQIMSNEFCETALSEQLGPGHLCAVPVVHGGTCFGDSGGPLTIVHDSKDTLIGIVSFGITGCALAPGMPDLYTRVSAYWKWIHVSAIKHVD